MQSSRLRSLQNADPLITIECWDYDLMSDPDPVGYRWMFMCIGCSLMNSKRMICRLDTAVLQCLIF